MERKVIAIAAMANNRVIGKEGGFPQDWNYPSDLRQFRETVQGHPILMGRKTYESFPEGKRPYPGSQNIVVSMSKSLDLPDEVIVTDNPIEFIQAYKAGQVLNGAESLFVIGGGSIYQVTASEWDEIRLTQLDREHAGDVLFPDFEQDFMLVEEIRNEDEGFSLCRYKRK